MKHFITPENLQQLREQYKNLCFKHHPDISGYDSTETMKEINQEYKDLTIKLAAGSKFEASEMEFADLYKEKIEALINLQGLILEIIGNWLWVSGNTREHKEVLKGLNFKFAPRKKAWYFKNYKFYKKTKEKQSLEEIRNMYGSQTIHQERREEKQSSFQLN